MKRYNKVGIKWILSRIVIPVLIFFLTVNVTYAYFTASSATKGLSKNIGIVRLTFDSATAGGVTMTSAGADLGTALPGQTIAISAQAKNLGTAPIYVILKINLEIDDEVIDSSYYTLAGTEIEYTEVNNVITYTTPATSLDAGATASAFNYNYIIPEELDNTYMDKVVSISINGYGIQTYEVTALNATNMLVALSNGGSYTEPVVESELPSIYQEVEYIELPSCTSYICTEVNWNTLSKVVLKYEQMTSTPGYHPIILASHAENSTSSTTPWICFDGTVSGSLSISPTVSTLNTPTTVTVTNSGASGLIKIGGWNDPSWTAKGRYYFVEFYDTNDECVNSFVPCYRKSDGVIGMYDTVTNTFYTNAGTGTFSKGPDVALPIEYQEVEYIESTGTQYIDTGIVPSVSNILDVEMDIKLNGTGGDQTLFGISSERCYCLNAMTGSNTWQFGSSNSWENLNDSSCDTSRHLIFCHYENLNQYANIDGIRKISSSTSPSGDGTNMRLFNHYNRYWTYGNLYSCKIWNGGQLVRDFIPCYRKSDGVIGLYDLVTGAFYTNAGTGTFVKGADVS